MDIITRYALEQLHKEGITLDMLITALDNLDKTVEEFHTIRDWIIGQDDRFADNIRLNL